MLMSHYQYCYIVATHHSYILVSYIVIIFINIHTVVMMNTLTVTRTVVLAALLGVITGAFIPRSSPTLVATRQLIGGANQPGNLAR